MDARGRAAAVVARAFGERLRAATVIAGAWGARLRAALLSLKLRIANRDNARMPTLLKLKLSERCRVLP